MLRQTIIFFVLILNLFYLIFPAHAEERTDIPKLTLPVMETMLEEAKEKGQVVLINFFATWCPPCREEIPGLIAIRRDMPEEKFLLIGLSVDADMNALRDYAEETEFNYPIFVAEEELMLWAGVSAIPHMVIFDNKGELQVNDAGLVPEEALRQYLSGLME